MSNLRRLFLTRCAAFGAAVVVGALKPLQALAAEWNKIAFDAKTLPEALKGAGVQNAGESKDKPDEKAMKEMQEVGTKYGECMAKAITERAGADGDESKRPDQYRRW